MSDDEVRELERRWRASGSDADEVAYLVARERAGTLERAQLELLARLGHAAAVMTTAVPAAPRPTTMNELEEWVRGAVVPGGLECLVRASLVVLIDFCRELLAPDRTSGGEQRRGVVDLWRPVIAAAEDWCLCPCPSHLDDAGVTADRAEEARSTGRIGDLVHVGLAVARSIAEHESLSSSDTDRAQAIDGLVDVCMLQMEPGRPPFSVTTELILTDLRGWILGPADPIAERVRARRA